MEEAMPLERSSPVRKEHNSIAGVHRRSTNACQRCKRRKIKCSYSSENSHSKCVACSRALTECLVDLPPDGVLRGHAYVATLEARIQTLERELQAKECQSGLTPDTTCSEQLGDAAKGDPSDGTGVRAESTTLPGKKQAPLTDVAILDMVHGRAFVPEIEEGLPMLPSSERARALLGTAYFYAQARYCIVDWNRLREWHRDRDAIAYAPVDGPVDSQIGAFFIWIIYAIGARLVPESENPTEAYFARARLYLPAVMASQNMVTVQALLCLVQYFFRAPSETPIWHIVVLALRLCIKLRYHRKLASSPDMPDLDPYTIELRKRFFWCAYCYDRSCSILTKLPFGISDSDIDIETPVDIDDDCTDQQKIRELQLEQEAGAPSNRHGITTTMTAALHHLHVYRIRSKILTNFTGPHARVPSLTDFESLLSELDQWRQQAPGKHDIKHLPQQNHDRVQATYLQAVLLVIRPILMDNAIDPDLTRLCVEFAADACQSAKTLSLNAQIPPDRITVYHCFYCGITLLQCLATMPTVLAPRRAHQAICACLSALSVYTRVLPDVAPFLRLFEELSNLLIYADSTHPSPKVRRILNRVVSSDPSETPKILHALSNDSHMSGTPQNMGLAQPPAVQFDSPGQPAVFGADLLPLEMPLDLAPFYANYAEMPELWTESWPGSLS